MSALSVLVIGDDPVDPDPEISPYRYSLAAHVECLRGNPAFDWLGVIAPAPDLVRTAGTEWQANVAATSVAEAGELPKVDVAVLITAPETRADLIQMLTGVRWVVVEPPLGLGVADSEAFLQLCETNGVTVFVNGGWRADPVIRSLENGGLEERIGRVIGGSGIYGTGLWHTGTLWIDVIQQVLGPVGLVQALDDARHLDDPVEPGDQAAGFAVTVERTTPWGRVVVTGFSHPGRRPLRPHLDLWGEKGRLSLSFEADATRLVVSPDGAPPHSAVAPMAETLAHFYANLAEAVREREAAVCMGDHMLDAERVIEAILESADENGERYHFR